MVQKLKIDVFGDTYRHHIFIKADHSTSTIQSNTFSAGVTQTTHLQGNLALNGTTMNNYVVPNMVIGSNYSLMPSDSSMLDAIQLWCSANFEGRWQISKDAITMVHSAPVTTEAPYKEEQYRAGTFEKNHGLMISFELEGDYTKFLLYWA